MSSRMPQPDLFQNGSNFPKMEFLKFEIMIKHYLPDASGLSFYFNLTTVRRNAAIPTRLIYSRSAAPKPTSDLFNTAPK